MQLVILASGKGSRLGNLTKTIPKCLIKVKNKSLIEYNLNFINKFKKKIIVTGYKSALIKKKFINKNIQFIKNNKYQTTNMVYSLFCASNLIKESLVVCYSDIIFDEKIYKKLKNNITCMIVKRNWYNYWKKRMNKNKILEDAENLIIKKNYIKSIGDKIDNEIPKYQFMGIVKISFNDFFKLKNFFKSLGNNKIEFTKFLNLAIQKKIIKIKALKTNAFWVEIDNLKDLKVAEKFL